MSRESVLVFVRRRFPVIGALLAALVCFHSSNPMTINCAIFKAPSPPITALLRAPKLADYRSVIPANQTHARAHTHTHARTGVLVREAQGNKLKGETGSTKRIIPVK